MATTRAIRAGDSWVADIAHRGKYLGGMYFKGGALDPVVRTREDGQFIFAELVGRTGVIHKTVRFHKNASRGYVL